MGWMSPRTWATDDVITATMMNMHVRANLNYLHDTSAVHGAAIHTNCTRYLWMNILKATDDPGDPDCYGSWISTYFITCYTTDNDNSNATQPVNAYIPPNFVSATTLYHLMCCTAGSGNVAVGAQVRYGTDGEAYDNTEDPGSIVLEQKALTQNQIHWLTMTTTVPDLSGLAAGDLLTVLTARDPTDALDTIGQGVHFLGCVLKYTATE